MFMRSGQLMYRGSPLGAAETWRTSAWHSEFCIGAGGRYQNHKPTTSAHEPAPLNLSPTNGASVRRKRMSDQVTNKSAAAEQSQARIVEVVLPSSTSSSDKLLRRIAILLFILVAGLLTVF